MLETVIHKAIGAAVPHASAATTINPCVSGDLACTTDIVGYIENSIPPAMFLAFFGLLFAMLVFYGFKLAVMSRADSAMTDTMQAIVHAFVGTILVLGAYVLASSFGTVGVIAPEVTEVGIIQVVVAYIIKLVGAVLVLNLVIQGFRMIMATDEGEIGSARTNLIQSLVGAAIVMLAVPVIQLVLPGSFNSGINEEIVGIANFLATLFGLMAALGIVVAGIMLIVSVEESLKDRAKSIIIASIVSIIVVMTSLGLIHILLPNS